MGKVRKFRNAIKKDPANVDVEMEKKDTLSKKSGIFDKPAIRKHMLTILKEPLTKHNKCCDAKIFQPSRETRRSSREKRRWQLKHKAFMQSIKASEEKCKQVKEMAQRLRTPVVGDMKPLEDALPTLEPSQKKNTVLEDIAIFHQVLNNPFFKQDPANTIKTHLQNKFRSDDTNM